MAPTTSTSRSRFSHALLRGDGAAEGDRRDPARARGTRRLLAKLIATDQTTSPNGRVAVNIVSGWFSGEFAGDRRAVARPRRALSPLRGVHPRAPRHLDRGQLHLPRRLLPLPRLHAEAQAARRRSPRSSRAATRAPRATWRRACPTGTSPTATRPRGSRKQVDDIQRQGRRRTGTPSGSASTPSPSPARPRRRRTSQLDEIIAKANPEAVNGFGDAVKKAGKASPEGEGNWAKSTFEDLVQYNDGFRTNLIGTPEQIAERIIALKRRGRRPDPARLPALPGGGRVLRPAGACRWCASSRPRRPGARPSRPSRPRPTPPIPATEDSPCRARTPSARRARSAIRPACGDVPAPAIPLSRRTVDRATDAARLASMPSRSPSAASRR